MTETRYLPSPVAMVRDQVAAFEASGGTEAGTHKGLPVVIITTVGAKTGALRKTPVMRVEHEGRYAAVATFGGSPTHPLWFLNIESNPHVTLQDGRAVRSYRCRIMTTGEPDTEIWWERAARVFPSYAEYRERLRGIRDVPIVVLEPE